MGRFQSYLLEKSCSLKKIFHVETFPKRIKNKSNLKLISNLLLYNFIKHTSLFHTKNKKYHRRGDNFFNPKQWTAKISLRLKRR